MLSASRARKLTNPFKGGEALLKPRVLRQLTDHQASTTTLELIMANVYDGIREGNNASTCYYEIDALTLRILESHGYKVEREEDDDHWYYVISWEE
jgi:hypothetical protein